MDQHAETKLKDLVEKYIAVRDRSTLDESWHWREIVRHVDETQECALDEAVELAAEEAYWSGHEDGLNAVEAAKRAVKKTAKKSEADHATHG